MRRIAVVAGWTRRIGTPLDFPLALFILGALVGLAVVYDVALGLPQGGEPGQVLGAVGGVGVAGEAPFLAAADGQQGYRPDWRENAP